MPLAKAVQLLKGGSSKWLNDATENRFEWQQGYSAFSASTSQEVQVRTYINSQAEHHRRRNFDEEFIAFLSKHKMDCNLRYVLG
jgi:hypothetical protein